MIKALAVAGTLSLAFALTAGSAHAINHTSDYKTNIQNYRYCDAEPLSSCHYADVISPSAYYLEDGKTITLIYTSTGAVQLKIDAGTVQMDTDASFPCNGVQYQCSVAAPTSGTCVGPKSGITCTGNKCAGGTNNGGSCNSSSACPGGACTQTSQCVVSTCVGGPQDGHYCGTGGVLCTSTNGQAGYKVRIIGNETGGEVVGGIPTYLLRGDGTTGDGCIVECPVTLGSDGSVNSSGLSSCTQSGDCLHSPIEAIHAVELIDPNGAILGIPGIGPATIMYSVSHDPTRDGDCVRVPSLPQCP